MTDMSEETLSMVVVFGMQNIREGERDEYTDALRRAFVERGADYIVLDSNMRGQRFLAAAVAHGTERGWLYHTWTGDDGQTEVYGFRLTDTGKAEFSRD